MFDKLVQVLVFAQLRPIVLDAYDRVVGLELAGVAVDGCIKALGGGEVPMKPNAYPRGALNAKRRLYRCAQILS